MSGGFVVSSIVVRRHEHLIVGRAHLPNESLDQDAGAERGVQQDKSTRQTKALSRHAFRRSDDYACCPCGASPASRKILRVTKFHTMTTAVAKILVIR